MTIAHENQSSMNDFMQALKEAVNRYNNAEHPFIVGLESSIKTFLCPEKKNSFEFKDFSDEISWSSLTIRNENHARVASYFCDFSEEILSVTIADEAKQEFTFTDFRKL